MMNATGSSVSELSREELGTLIAAAQNVDLHTGSIDHATREYWYSIADDALANRARYEETDRLCQCATHQEART